MTCMCDCQVAQSEETQLKNFKDYMFGPSSSQKMLVRASTITKDEGILSFDKKIVRDFRAGDDIHELFGEDFAPEIIDYYEGVDTEVVSVADGKVNMKFLDEDQTAYYFKLVNDITNACDIRAELYEMDDIENFFHICTVFITITNVDDIYHDLFKEVVSNPSKFVNELIIARYK